MAYELRRITDEDEEYFLKCGVKSPFGSPKVGFGRYIIENLEEGVKMVFIGGQGIMTEEGEEWSEMAAYSAFVWKEKCYIVEFFRNAKYSVNNDNCKVLSVLYKLKNINSIEPKNEEKTKFINIVKNVFYTYEKDTSGKTICENVDFIDAEVRWK